MSFQPALNNDFVGLKFTFSSRVAPLGVTLRASPFGHRFFIEVQLTGDLGKVQAALLVEEPDLTVKFVSNHGSGVPPDSKI
jgi:hypothetical protein